MKINITNKQYLSLIKMVYLGNWMINAIRTGQKGDEYVKEYEDLEQYIYSFAKDYGMEKYIEFDKKMAQHFPTNEFEVNTDLNLRHEEYDEHTFWEELFYKLYERDMRNKYSPEEISKMTFEERIRLEEPFRQKWDKELEKYGVERLEIKEEN